MNSSTFQPLPFLPSLPRRVPFMWSKVDFLASKESDPDDDAHPMPVPPSASESGGNPYGAKRQRRPSVRLGEIGDLPAAVVTDRRQKPISVLTPLQPNQHKSKDKAIDSGRNGTVHPANSTKIGRGVKTWPPIHGDNRRFPKNASIGDELSLRPADVPSTCSIAPKESSRHSLHDAIVKKNPKRVEHIARWKRGNLKFSTPVENSSVAIDSAVPNDADVNANRQNANDVPSDEENACDKFEAFRQCDPYESDYQIDADENSNSMESRPLGLDDVAQEEPDFREYLPEQEGQELVRSKDNGMYWKSRKRNHRLNDCIKFIPDGKHERQGKSFQETNDNQEIGESSAGHKDISLYHSHLPSGVTGWLQGLGLGKYAQHFEAHEVDPEVLPLLTLDDLKDMGITAVGSRRKMFYAIQRLGK